MTGLSAKPSDTSPDVWLKVLEVYRAMPPERKLELVEDANRWARQLSWAGINRRHAGESLERRRRRLLGLVLGEDLATDAYGPLEDYF